jgi:opacity protein-like surface antigen
MKRSFLLSTAALAIAILPLGAAQAQGPTPFDNPGIYFGAYAGGASDTFKITDEYVETGSLDQFVAGFIVGDRFNRPPGQIWSAAIEGEVGFLGGHNNNESIVPDGAPGITEDDAPQLIDGSVDICGYDQNSVERVRFLAGLPSGNIEPFAAVGVAITDADVCYYDLVAGGTFVGLTLGAGANIALGPSFFIRPEVLYDIYGKKNYGDVSVGLQTFTARVAAIFKFPTGP